MPEPLIHFAIPFASLTLARIGYRKALLVSIFAIIPDLDVLFLVHRSQSHSLIPVIAVTLTAYLLLKGTRYPTYVFLGSVGVASHIVLDMFGGFTPAVWPLWDQSIKILMDLSIHIASPPVVIFNPQILIEPTTFELIQTVEGPLFTSEGLIISVILLLPTLLTPIHNRLSKKNPQPEPKHNPTLAKV